MKFKTILTLLLFCFCSTVIAAEPLQASLTNGGGWQPKTGDGLLPKGNGDGWQPKINND